MLGAADPLPFRPQRILIAGTSGAGKPTLARRIAELAGLPYTELDSLYHGPGWTPRPESVDEVTALAHGTAGVSEWQYAAVRDLLAARADLLVWLDLPFWRAVLPRVVRRTWQRRGGRELLWNGNAEAPFASILADRDHIVRWAIRTRRTTARLLADRADEPEFPVIVRLRTVAEVEAWLAGPFAEMFDTPTRRA